MARSSQQAESAGGASFGGAMGGVGGAARPEPAAPSQRAGLSLQPPLHAFQAGRDLARTQAAQQELLQQAHPGYARSADEAAADARRCSEVEPRLPLRFTRGYVESPDYYRYALFHANPSHNLTRSPFHI